MKVMRLVERNLLITISQWRWMMMLVFLNILVLVPWLLTGSSVTNLLQGNTAADFRDTPLLFPLFWYWTIIWPTLLCQQLIAQVAKNSLISVVLKLQKRSTYVLGQLISITLLIVGIDGPMLVFLSLFQLKFNWVLIISLVMGSILTAMVWLVASFFGTTVTGFTVELIFPLINLSSQATWLPSTVMMYKRISVANIGILQLVAVFLSYAIFFYFLAVLRFKHLNILEERGN